MEKIKEILEWLNDKDYYIEEFGYKFKRLSLEENETLLDYITNLQEENEFLKDLKYFTTDEIYKELGKRLQECADVSNELASECNDNQERIEKAIEYIKEIGKLNDAGNYQQFKDYKEYNDLYNILTGDEE